MDLEWSRLRILDAVARTGSVTHAAEMLHLTGPAVSQQLRRIEAEIGRPVVVAAGRGVKLTDAGRLLADCAAQVAELTQQAKNDLDDGADLSGTVRIGAIASAIRGFLTPELVALRTVHPGVVVTLEDGETDAHLDRLTRGSLDLVIAESWGAAPLPLPAGVTAAVLFRERGYLALPADHPASAHATVDIRDVADEVWSTCARDSRDHAALVQIARAAGVDPVIRHFVADPHTQKTLVAQGLGLACLPFSSPPADAEDIVYRRLTPAAHRDITLLTHDCTPSRAVAAVRDALLDGGSALPR
ncbi:MULTISPECIES: LysR family transcriptional regulator [unclassified Brevibacterium]|uniref:LysR family transcriptional regulator n=1 Tax=unclassified Brevibacterium TaxID=2614124 RepID=UPI0010F4B0EB|nr:MULTISPECIES: LysR family transcriptional regulator [unclassified Brevibacterium]MCM1013869.1 LysR family transcriptional regulator [Brevibacterium sp. XM4083]